MTVPLLGRCCPCFFDRFSGIFNAFSDRSRCSFGALLNGLTSIAGSLFHGLFGLLHRALILCPAEAERQS